MLSPHWLMSDLAGQFFNAWVAVMGESPKKLFCTWHVDRAWQMELRSKVKDTVMAADIYKMLRTVLQQTEVPIFQKYMSEFLKRLPTLSMEFYNYFQSEWLGRTESWAYCYRRGMGINTNMTVEAFHRVFKYSYLKGKTNRRVDNCLIGLMQFIRDKAFERAIKLTKGKSTFKTRVIRERHTKSKGLCIDAVTEDGEFRWRVTNIDEIPYTVIKQANYCMDNGCQIRCEECKICIHQFICDCPDSLIHNTICKHVHLLQRYLAAKKDQTEEPGEPAFPQYIDPDYKEKEVKLVASGLQQKDKIQDNLNETLKEATKRQLLVMLDQLNDCDNNEVLQVLSKKLTAAKHLFISMKEQKSLSPLKLITSSPANKSIDKQNRFKSTKKKRKRTNKVRFAKPTKEDISSLFAAKKNGK